MLSDMDVKPFAENESVGVDALSELRTDRHITTDINLVLPGRNRGQLCGRGGGCPQQEPAGQGGDVRASGRDQKIRSDLKSRVSRVFFPGRNGPGQYLFWKGGRLREQDK